MAVYVIYMYMGEVVCGLKYDWELSSVENL